MYFDRLFGASTSHEFISEYYQRLPFSRQGGAKELVTLGSWDILLEVLKQPQADVLVVRQGQRYEGPPPHTAAAAHALCEQGYTLLVRHAERHEPAIAQLARDFERQLAAPVNVHIYATPPGGHGFSWHYDAEEVFIVQTSGRKTYSLRKNTVQPWPLEETLPSDMQFELETQPLMRATLEAGDWLYIPCGYWHKAETPEPQSEEDDAVALSLAVGVMTPAALDLFDLLRAELRHSIIWRQRLPVVGGAATMNDEELENRLQEIAQFLATDLARELKNPTLWRRWLEQQRRDSTAEGECINS